MKVLIFGNDSYEPDSLPLRILPRLRELLPHIIFVPADPNEDWEIDSAVTAIDTVINLDQPRVFDSLEAFEAAPRVSLHDFDALAQLRLLLKIGRIRTVRILGLPPNYDAETAAKWVEATLKIS